jgi:hypothetical protein
LVIGIDFQRSDQRRHHNAHGAMIDRRDREQSSMSRRPATYLTSVLSAR